MNPELKRAIFEWIVTDPLLRAVGGWPDCEPIPLHWMEAPRDPPMPYLVYRLKENASPLEDGSSQVTLMVDVWDSDPRSTRCEKIAYRVRRRMDKYQQFCDSQGLPLVSRASFQDGGPVPTGSEKVWRYENSWLLFVVDTPED